MADAGAILLFDGVCNVCNGAVNFVIDHDPEGRFRFASLQSPTARELLARHGLPDVGVSTMVVLHDGQAHLESDGVLCAAGLLGGAFRLLAPLGWLPRSLRDALYRAFARRRYRLFGKSEYCRVPTPEIRARFLA